MRSSYRNERLIGPSSSPLKMHGTSRNVQTETKTRYPRTLDVYDYNTIIGCEWFVTTILKRVSSSKLEISIHYSNGNKMSLPGTPSQCVGIARLARPLGPSNWSPNTP